LSKIEVGDFVTSKPDNDYETIIKRMTCGVVMEVNENNIKVKVIEHLDNATGIFSVDPTGFKVIGHVKPFDRAEYFEKLKSGIKNAILKYDLRGADMRDIALRDVDMRGVVLHDADMRGVDMRGVDMRNADMRGANLYGTILYGADMRGANICNADMRDADMRDADMRGVVLHDADMRGANLCGVNMRHADMRGANLYGTDMRHADMRGANMRGADICNADMHHADMRGANLCGVNMRYVNMHGVDMCNVDLSAAKGLLQSINYLEANFERSERGYIVYKTFGHFYKTPSEWKIEPNSIIEENVLFDRCQECGCGINVASLDWIKRNCENSEIWKCLIEWPWLVGVCVPYHTDGKIRCERLRLLEVVKQEA